MVRISAAAITRALLLIAVVLTGLSILVLWAEYWFQHDRLLGFRTLLDINLELSIPTWYQAVLLILSAVLVAMIAVVRRAKALADWKHWVVLAVLFLAVSVQDVTGAHDRLLRLPHSLVADEVIWRYSWLVTGMALLLAVLAWLIPFVRGWPRATRGIFLRGAALYLIGAAGFEALGGLYATRHGFDNLPYNYLATTEEFLEMLGQITFVSAWLRQLGEEGAVTLDVWDAAGVPPARAS